MADLLHSFTLSPTPLVAMSFQNALSLSASSLHCLLCFVVQQKQPRTVLACKKSRVKAVTRASLLQDRVIGTMIKQILNNHAKIRHEQAAQTQHTPPAYTTIWEMQSVSSLSTCSCSFHLPLLDHTASFPSPISQAIEAI